MRYTRRAVILASTTLAAASCLWTAFAEYGLLSPSSGLAAEKAKPLPPLKVDRSAPLLLDAPAEKKPSSKSKGPKADNHACHVCHTNYQEECLAVTHADANVGCVKCHGESIAHRNDENNITPPDTMYPTEGIDAACVKCHETHDAPARKVLARYTERCAGKKSPDQVVCTDCHGEHRLKLRTGRRDKKTGKLISGSGAKPASPSGQNKSDKK